MENENLLRLDLMLVKLNITKSRSKALMLIKDECILVNNKIINKASFLVSENDKIDYIQKEELYVSRGGNKLAYAIKNFNVNINGLNCLDIGASTGGFTQCLLKNGAKSVIALDVGTGQLVEELKIDQRVISLEQTNIKDFDESKYKIDFITADVSFISLTLILEKIYSILMDKCYGIVLVKPQFEAGILGYKNFKNGIVKDKKIHKKVLENVILYAENCGFRVINICISPIKGQDGNIEYLLYFQKDKDNTNKYYPDFNKLKI